jgi:hypothetical protein
MANKVDFSARKITSDEERSSLQNAKRVIFSIKEMESKTTQSKNSMFHNASCVKAKHE